MASQSQPQSVPSTPSTSDPEKKRKHNDDATLNPAMASFGGYAADEEAEVAPSSHVKSSKKKRKKYKEKRRHSHITAGDYEEDQGTQVTFASSPSSRKHRKMSTSSGDEDEDHIEVTTTPPAKRRRKSNPEKAGRRDIENDAYDATEETGAEKKRSLVDTINRPRTPTQAGDSSGTEQHAETPIRPPPRNHFTNQKHNATTKVTKRRALRKVKAVQHEKNGNGNGITSDADSMRTKLSSNISNDMFSRPLARRVAFDFGLAKPMSALAIRREAVGDGWEETTGKVRGLVYTSGDAEAEENIAYSAQYLEATPNTTIAYGNTTRKMLMLSAGTTCDVKAEKGVSLCEVTRGGPLLVVVAGGDGRGGKSFRIDEGGLWRVRAGEACHVTNVAGAEVRMNISNFGSGEHED